MSAGKEIPKPPGYRSAVLFDREKHRRLGVAPGAQQFASGLAAVYLTDLEIARAGLDYPVVFAAERDESIVPVGIVGVEAGINLLCDKHGRWLSDYYCPAYVRRYPFFMGRLSGSEEKGVICVDDSALVEGGSELINANGEMTAHWQEILKLVEQMHLAQSKTSEFCQRLQHFNLLEKFDADFHPQNPTSGAKPPKRLNGLLRVSKDALKALDADAIVSLMRHEDLLLIHAHLNSLQRFDLLLNRYAED